MKSAEKQDNTEDEVTDTSVYERGDKPKDKQGVISADAAVDKPTAGGGDMQAAELAYMPNVEVLDIETDRA